MSRFIKLSNTIINVSNISKIKSYTKPSAQHHIEFINDNFNGFTIFGWGIWRSNPESIIIFKDNEPEDYKIISEWIDKIEPVSKSNNSTN